MIIDDMKGLIKTGYLYIWSLKTANNGNSGKSTTGNEQSR